MGRYKRYGGYGDLQIIVVINNINIILYSWYHPVYYNIAICIHNGVYILFFNAGEYTATTRRKRSLA